MRARQHRKMWGAGTAGAAGIGFLGFSGDEHSGYGSDCAAGCGCGGGGGCGGS